MELVTKRKESNIDFLTKKSGSSPLVYVAPDEMFPYKQNYGEYVSLTETGSCIIYTKDLTQANWNSHVTSILNIIKDGIEKEFLHNARITVVFSNSFSIRLSIFDYYFNLILWNMILSMGEPISSNHLFFEPAITKGAIKKYVDEKFIKAFEDKFIGTMRPEFINLFMNNIIDRTMYQFSNIDNFSMYLANTINLEDNLILAKQSPEFNALLHADLSNIPIEDVKNHGMKLTERAIELIKGSDHCLADSFKAREGINPRQYKEFSINIGSKPDGNGGIFPTIINKSFINGGVAEIQDYFIESHGGRIAQIIAKCNVGNSGHFARLLGLNNRDTTLHQDPHYDCHTKNYQECVIVDSSWLRMYQNRYYRVHPNGMEYMLHEYDTFLIGQKIYLRSPMTCASHARGEGICYKCYGRLAYTNSDINIGQLAAELLSAALTQRLLSAKHLLESLAQKLSWTQEFKDLFDIEFNLILLQDDIDYSGYTMIIDPNNIDMQSEDDDLQYNEYITQFEIRRPDGSIVMIKSAESDPLYISTDLNNIIRNFSDVEDKKIEINMEKLRGSVLFLLYIMNDELSKTLEMIKSIINKKFITSSYDRHQILQKFAETVMEGGLDTIGVHLEIILANQIRHYSDILAKPDWSNENEMCDILTLNEALTNNPSITTTMSYQKLSKVLYNPLSFRKNAPSFLDLLFMEKPQDFMLTRSLISDDWKPEPDRDQPVPLVSFDD